MCCTTLDEGDEMNDVLTSGRSGANLMDLVGYEGEFGYLLLSAMVTLVSSRYPPFFSFFGGGGRGSSVVL